MPRPARQRQTGFSLTELIVALVVAIILMTVALPMFLRAYNSYKLTNAARDVADILRLTRYEAIRLNKQVNCVLQPDTTDATLTRGFMTDASGNALTGVSAKNIVLGSGGNLVAAGSVPGSGSLPALANIGGAATVNIAPGGATIQFDPRGALRPPTVNAFYLMSAAAPDAGYRALFLMPAGSIQIWTADPTGNWQEQR